MMFPKLPNCLVCFSMTNSYFVKHWMVPRQANPYFTGRKEILNLLRERLCSGKQDAAETEQKRCVIYGMGGSGKSEVCLKFAYENKERRVSWVAESEHLADSNK